CRRAGREPLMRCPPSLPQPAPAAPCRLPDRPASSGHGP
ncbi:MAG: hypothetical protein AVDCRST_MAG08-2617, partial [uncultured Acetobacteraceae bacterium]